jgi:hypothetical protein
MTLQSMLAISPSNRARLARSSVSVELNREMGDDLKMSRLSSSMNDDPQERKRPARLCRFALLHFVPPPLREIVVCIK